MDYGRIGEESVSFLKGQSAMPPGSENLPPDFPPGLEELINSLVEKVNTKNAFNKEMAEELRKQKDRGAAIIGAARLDECLELYLRANWISDDASKKTRDELFNPSGPLGSFWTQVQVCYLSRLIGPKTYGDLRIIRDIRNAFAHWVVPKTKDAEQSTYKVVSFKTDTIRDKCKNLTVLTTRWGKHPPRTARRRFIDTVTHLTNVFEHMATVSMAAQRSIQRSGNPIVDLPHAICHHLP